MKSNARMNSGTALPLTPPIALPAFTGGKSIGPGRVGRNWFDYSASIADSRKLESKTNCR